MRFNPIVNQSALTTFALYFVCSGVAFGDANLSGEELQTNSELQAALGRPADPTLQWEAYRKRHGLKEGFNQIGEKKFFIGSGEFIVGKSIKDKGFIASRTVAFKKAVLSAKSDLAESVGSMLSSERGLELIEVGGEVAPSMGKVQEHLSIMDKTRVLIESGLDDEIKKYDPNWDGTGKTEEEKRQALAIQAEKYSESLRQNARLFIQGATPIFNAEGPVDGEYTVVVGIVWSPKLTRVAEAMYNPYAEIPIAKPGQPIKEQIQRLVDNAKDGAGIDATMGIRVWRDENGERVVLSFAAASGVGSKAIAKKKTALQARAQIAQFIGENVLSDGILSGNETVAGFDDESLGAFDESSFEQKIQAKARDVCLIGVAPIKFWKGRHFNSQQKMVVHVLEWSRSSLLKAKDAGKIAAGDKGGMCSGWGETATPKTAKKAAGGTGGVAVGGMKGAESSKDDY